MLRREHWPRLREHLTAILQAVERPVIVKIGTSDTPDSLGAVEQLVDVGVRIVHANVGNAVDQHGLALIRKLHERCPFLIIGGSIRTSEHVISVIDAGADAVAIGTAAMHDPTLCGRVQTVL